MLTKLLSTICIAGGVLIGALGVHQQPPTTGLVASGAAVIANLHADPVEYCVRRTGDAVDCAAAYGDSR